MATLKYDHVKISAVSACVPRAIAYNTDLGYLLPQEEIEKTISAIGIREKRITDTETCASDLCAKAAEQLFQDNHIERSSIDMVLFMSQLPDYRMPATAPILQHRLPNPLPQWTSPWPVQDTYMLCLPQWPMPRYQE